MLAASLLRFLFWNVNRQPRESMIAAIARDHDIDVLLLAENRVAASVIEQALNVSAKSRRYHFARPGVCEKVQMFVRFAPSLIRSVWDSSRTTLREMDLPGKGKLLIGGVHLESKLHSSADDQTAAAVEVARDIADQERKAGHDRTVLTGDFNMNPFDYGVASARGLNAAMTPAIAKRGSRSEAGRPYAFFYNPMWNHFGDQGPNPPGTYYYANSPHPWNTFDQVLIRPSLIDAFAESELRVLTAVDGASLLTPGGIPNARTASDHLPLLFALDL